MAKLDVEFQAAVKAKDATAMARILHPDVGLVLGDGHLDTRAEQPQEAAGKLITYEIQDEDPGTETVRVRGDTVIATARPPIKGFDLLRQYTHCKPQMEP